MLFKGRRQDLGKSWGSGAGIPSRSLRTHFDLLTRTMRSDMQAEIMAHGVAAEDVHAEGLQGGGFARHTPSGLFLGKCARLWPQMHHPLETL